MSVKGLLYEGLPISRIHVYLDIEPANVFKYKVESFRYITKVEFDELLKAFEGFEFEALEVLNGRVTLVFRREYKPKKGEVEYVLKELDLLCPEAIVSLTSLEIVTNRLSNDEVKKVLKILEENGIEAGFRHELNHTIFFEVSC